MKSKIILAVLGLLLSFLLIAANIWVKFRTLPYYIYEMETNHLTFVQWQNGVGYSYLIKYGGNLPALTWSAFWWEKLLFNTVSILLLSFLISFLNPNKPKETVILSIISLIPFLLYTLIQPNGYFIVVGWIFWIPYVVLALKIPYLIDNLKEKTSSSLNEVN
jgi:hypothetical protein